MLCTNCLQGYCNRHPTLDHGKRANELKTKASGIDIKMVLKSNIKAQIEKLENAAKGTSKNDIEAYKEELEINRNDMYKNSRDSSSNPNKKSKTSSLSLEGLCPSVRSVMMDNENSESDESRDSTEKRKEKKRKKEKKHKNDKKHKKHKKEKKHKNDKKEKKHKKEKSSSSDSSDSSSVT